jgi:haloacetate dehalogenase
MPGDFFDGFTLQTLPVEAGELRFRLGGAGPPLLLLHGNPQTHAMWHAVAPALARRFTVVCADLRGYGGSHKPAASSDHAAYAKREMARDMVQLMQRLGHGSFHLAGHDRGGRVAQRLALDHPERVRKLAVLDIVPTLEHFERTNMASAMGYYHWFWLAQPHPFPETLIGHDPRFWFKSHTTRPPKYGSFFHPEALEDYLKAVDDEGTVRGICEDYRAAATIDLEHDRQSRSEGVKIACPLLSLWGKKGKIDAWFEPLEIWRAYCRGRLEGGPVDSGHYLAEEAPEEVLDHFQRFFGED